MKNTQTVACLFALSGLLSLNTLAQDNERGPRRQGPPGGRPPAQEGGPRGGGPLLMHFDTNKDGVVDAKEIANAPAVLKALDKDNDGQLTLNEFRPMPPARRGGLEGGPRGPRGGEIEGDEQRPGRPGGPGPGGPGGRPGMSMFGVLDLNNDGVLDADEIRAASTSLKSLDADGDGVLTGEELRPARPGRGGQGGQGGQGGRGGEGRPRGERPQRGQQ